MNPCSAQHVTADVLENVPLAERTFRVRLRCPDIASRIRPGQFLMLRLPGRTDPLLARPFALYDTVLDDAGEPFAVDVVYLVVGKMTKLLADVREGDRLEIWGPLGNGFPELGNVPHVALVAGGIGQTPFLAYVRELLGSRGYAGEPPRRRADRVTLFYGVRSANLAAGVDAFQEAGATVHIATEDGTAGERGYVTRVLADTCTDAPIVACGPEPMLHAVAKLAADWHVGCYVSLETPMACGVGICFSCVTRVKQNDGWDYQRVCVDGPVFDATKLVWEND